MTMQVIPLRIPFTIPVAPDRSVERFVYCFLIKAERVILIDTGVAGAEQRIEQLLEELGAGASGLSAVILTHSHPDHIGSACRLKRLSGAPVCAHSGEQLWIENIARQREQRPVPGFDRLVAGSVKIDRILADGDRLPLSNRLSLSVLHTPGHSAGSISLWLEQERALFCGDAIPCPGDMPIYEDVRAAALSLVRILTLAPIASLYSSWSDPVFGEAASRSVAAGLDYIKEIHRVVCGFARPGQNIDPMELCRECVGRLGLPPFAVNPLTARSFTAHLIPGLTETLDNIASN